MDLTLSGFIFQKEFFRFLVILFHIFAANLAVGTILFGYIHFMITQKISRKELLIEHQVEPSAQVIIYDV